MGEMINPGMADIAATSPANAGEPVSSSINHGIVIMTIELPKPDAKFDIWWRTTGALFFIIFQVYSASP